MRSCVRGHFVFVLVLVSAAISSAPCLADKGPINEGAYDGGGLAADSMIPPTSDVGRTVDAAITKYPFDLRRSEELMTQAQEWLWTELGIASELAGTAAIAALLTGKVQPAPGERVGVVICAANADIQF